MRYEPADEDTCEEAYNRQEQLTCDEVEQIEDRHAEQLMLTPSPQGQRTNRTKHHACNRHRCRCPLTRGAHLLFQEGSAHLMQGNQRSQCCHRQECIEQERNGITQT